MSDLIDRQALCEYALNQKDKSITPNDIMRFPSAQPEVLACGSGELDVRSGSCWIPCTERLPEEGTCFYLATIANRGLFFTTTLPDDVGVVRWDYDRRKGHNSWHWCTERTVIAWMPLPEPYREETT